MISVRDPRPLQSSLRWPARPQGGNPPPGCSHFPHPGRRHSVSEPSLQFECGSSGRQTQAVWPGPGGRMG
eukprot:37083-Chlamydomonas_euryale.AAC.2